MDVSPLQDFLGKLVEKSPGFFLKLGSIESKWLEDSLQETKIDRPIYIAGLARSGSTILLELLASHPDTATHQYKDFPLVHIPVWWNWFLKQASPGKHALVERAHKDRIQVSPDSPEAMEEILWMAFFSQIHDLQVNNVLDAQTENPKFAACYRDHIRKLLLAKGGARYLSKGNYNLSRLEYIHKLFPDALFLIPVRDPAAHIASLMKQHRLFTELETQDPRVRDYMRRAGHFEFGLDRRIVNFNNPDETRRIESLWKDGQEIRGWAAYWSATYSHIAALLESKEALAAQTLIVDYADFCQDPAKTLSNIYRHCALEIPDETLHNQAKKISPPTYYKQDFNNSELIIIEEETAETVNRIQTLNKLRLE